jgi:hypothetical protein
MLGGGAGHIADMVARMKANKAMQQNRRRRKHDEQLSSSSGQTPLRFKKISKEELDIFREKLIKRRRKEAAGVIVFFIIVLLITLYLYLSIDI